MNNEIATVNRFDDDDLRSVTNFQDAAELVAASGGVIEDFAESYGNGFTLLPTDDKARLTRVPIFLIEWRFSDGDQGEFASIALVTESDEKFIINDGSTGIRDQLKKVTEARIKNGGDTPAAYRGLLVKGGLRSSTYDYTDEKSGKTSKATTFYLSN